jgi:hypothetical protein
LGVAEQSYPRRNKLPCDALLLRGFLLPFVV